MVGIQCATAEIRRGKEGRRKKERRKKPQDENIMAASAMQGGQNKLEIRSVVRGICPIAESSMTDSVIIYCACVKLPYFYFRSEIGQNGQRASS